VPRTQCGTITFSLRTLSSPSRDIVATVQSIACSSAIDPESRCPKRSVSSAMRFHAPAESACAAAMMRLAIAAYLAGIASAVCAGSEAAVTTSESAAKKAVRTIWKSRV
jgi:hypothetical protein